jgi:hypothetical protein
MNDKKIDFGDAKYPPTVTLKTVGDEIQGKIVEVGEVPLEDRNAGYIHIKILAGVRTFWLGTVLTKHCEKEGIKKGDYIGIKYLGEVSSGKQSPYKNYDIRIIKQTLIGGIEG